MASELYRLGFGVLIALACHAQAEASVPAPSPELRGTDQALAEAAEQSTPLYLAVFINGNDTKLVANFTLLGNGTMSSSRSELAQLGIRVPDGTADVIALAEISGLSWDYDEPRQVLELSATDEALIPNVMSATGKSDLIAPQPGYGAVLNYSAFASTPDTILEGAFDISGVSLSLDGRLYSPYGVLSSTGVARSEGFGIERASVMRYDTSWSYADQKRMLNYTVGDIVSGGFAWTRPVRLGGAQVRRDFGLRQDIVTAPLLRTSGSAALPSTIDVYIGNVRTYSSDVGPGPFELTDIPTINGHGDARIVLRDANGRETETSLPFFAARDLLKGGTLDFTLEAGLPRQEYGQQSFAYGSDLMASGGLRYALSDRLTLQGHAEGNRDLVMGGAGATTVLFNRIEVTGAAGASLYTGEAGYFAYGSLRTEFFGIDVNLSSMRTFGEYADLAYVTAKDGAFSNTFTDYSFIEPPKALDVVSVNVPLYFDESSLGLNLIHAERSNQTDLIVSAAYSRSLGWNDLTMRFNAFRNFGDAGGFGMFAGFSMPLGQGRQGYTSVSHDGSNNYSPTAGVNKSQGSEIGSFGYRANVSGMDTSGSNDAGASYRSKYGLADLRLHSNSSRVTASGSFDGSLVMAGGDVFVSNTIHDSFAVVDVGVPDVPVLLQNRPFTSTGSSGKALVTGLRSYANNKISIDVTRLPVDATVAATDAQAVPARRSGVNVNFNGGNRPSALVVLRDTAGAFIPAGTAVKLNGGLSEYFVGYDGEVWFDNLKPANNAVVEMSDASCAASFDYASQPGRQVVIDPVECK